MKPLITAVLLGCLTVTLHAKPVAFNAPDFDVRIELTDKAQSYLSQHNEVMQVRVTYADFYGVGMKVFGVFDYTFQGPAVIAMRDLKFSPQKLKTLKVADYEVHIMAASGHKSSHWNVLDCEFLQDNLSKLQYKTHTLRCGLVAETGQR
jgi:hypothetical protein